jgi:hypothetical protein
MNFVIIANGRRYEGTAAPGSIETVDWQVCECAKYMHGLSGVITVYFEGGTQRQFDLDRYHGDDVRQCVVC